MLDGCYILIVLIYLILYAIVSDLTFARSKNLFKKIYPL